ncbi:hypothetical protein BV20DRAFT_969368 [Pilatotrama ljubarskyi]|nr:hypothetical protein BV20DRAFT_969368 [Pilatotrama ljubarskyi]
MPLACITAAHAYEFHKRLDKYLLCVSPAVAASWCAHLWVAQMDGDEASCHCRILKQVCWFIVVLH